MPLSAHWTGIVHGDVFAETKNYYYSAPNLNPGALVPGYAVANFRLEIDDDRGWSVSAILKNALDKAYYTGGFPLGTILGVNTLNPALPRTFLFQARYAF